MSRARSNLKDVIQQAQIEKAFKTIPASTAVAEATPAVADENSMGGGKPEQNISDENGTLDDEKAKKKAVPAVETAAGTAATGESANPVADAFANEMPLSFRLWKPPVQTSEHLPRSLGKATTGYVSV